MAQVLVLNQNYEPLNICHPRRALVLVDGGKAEVLEVDGLVLRSPTREWRVPSVIRLNHLIKRPRPRVRLTRREIFLRDQHTCQYCGVRSKDLTLDHVVPKHRGGRHHWENLVSACRSCNHRKGGKTVEEAKMALRRSPFEPKATPQYLFQHYLDGNETWRKFIGEVAIAAPAAQPQGMV
ncbi:MAG TPA: HNH endonuclease [Chloroflexota bacterium]|nr:HNH endonuclease [Chloroflexota bacterium]